VMEIGAPANIARAYNELNFGRLVHQDLEGARTGDQQAAEITAAWFEDINLERATSMAQGGFCHVCVEVRFHEDMTDPIFGWSLRNDARHVVFATSSQYDHPHTGTYRAGDTVVVRTGFPMQLAMSRYALSPYVARSGAGHDLLDAREDMVSLHVHSTRSTGGVVDLEQVFEIRRP
jgi:Wzt C-terminal domain